jgi:hypothetical protein
VPDVPRAVRERLGGRAHLSAVPDEVDLAGRHPVAFGFGHVLTRVSQAGGPLVNRHESD